LEHLAHHKEGTKQFPVLFLGGAFMLFAHVITDDEPRGVFG
jgi:hypothetical protein